MELHAFGNRTTTLILKYTTMSAEYRIYFDPLVVAGLDGIERDDPLIRLILLKGCTWTRFMWLILRDSLDSNAAVQRDLDAFESMDDAYGRMHADDPIGQFGRNLTVLDGFEDITARALRVMEASTSVGESVSSNVDI